MLARASATGRDGKRILLASGIAATIAAVSMVITTATFGLFSSVSSSQTPFTAGGVTFSTTPSGSCDFSDLVPGGTAGPCQLATATYSGSVPAYLGIDVLVETQPGATTDQNPSPLPLYDPSDSANDLQLTISDNQTPSVNYTVPTSPTTCPGSAPGGSTCYELDDELVSTSTVSSSTPAVTFSVSASLPSPSTAGYQGGAAKIIVTAHAVQSSNNPGIASCSTAGIPCTAIHWS